MLYCCSVHCRQPSAATPGQQFLQAQQRARYTSRRTTAHAAEPVDTSSDDDEGEGRVLTVSLTIVVPHEDIPLALFDTMSNYLTLHSKAGSVSTERGGGFQHLHIQGVYQRRGTSTQALKSELLRYLKAHVPNYDALHASVCLKQASNKGLHTFEGLVAYSRKYQGREDFRNTLHNVDAIQLAEGEQLLKQYGAALKHRIPLTLHNIMERAATYHVFELRERIMPSLGCMVYAMVRSGQYYLDPEWVVPFKGQGMQGDRADVVWRSCIAPATITPGDVRLVLYSVHERLSIGAAVPDAMPDDAVLKQLVSDAEAQQKGIGELIDSRPALRPLLYARAQDPTLLRLHGRRGAAVEGGMQLDASELIGGEGVAYGMLS